MTTRRAVTSRPLTTPPTPPFDIPLREPCLTLKDASKSSQKNTKSSNKVSGPSKSAPYPFTATPLTPRFADLQTNIEARQKLESQQQENRGVQKVCSQLPGLEATQILR